MKIFQTSKARILFVSVPEDARALHIGDFTGDLIYYRTLSIMPRSIQLPDGQWQFLSLLKDATEENAASVVDDCPYFAKCWRKYDARSDEKELHSYCGGRFLSAISCWTSVESLHSLANHLGCEGNVAILVEPNK